MLEDTPGIHHVTGIVGDAQSSLDSYAGVLGLGLVKRTVNHEDVLRYHLYYGNGDASPGSPLTPFPYPGDPPGRPGNPQIAAAGLVVPPDALDYWADRLAAHGVRAADRERFYERALRFEDPTGPASSSCPASRRWSPGRRGRSPSSPPSAASTA